MSAWLNTSKDAITGNEQQGGAFWHRILKYVKFHGGNQQKHSQPFIKSRWTNINAKCAKFIGFYSQIERLRQSGHTEQNNVMIKFFFICDFLTLGMTSSYAGANTAGLGHIVSSYKSVLLISKSVKEPSN